MNQRVLLAGLFHETHTFLAERTTLADFALAEGVALLARIDDGSPLGAFLRAAHREGWEVVPTLDLRATPSGTVDDAVLEFFWSRFTALAAPALAHGVDALFLVLHGSMVTVSCRDVEGEILERIRRLPGAAALPIFGVLDLHANLTARMARHSDGLIVYRENPHTDAAETARRAAVLLRRTLTSGVRPTTLWQSVPIVWAPPGTGTAQGPMVALEQTARHLETADPDIWAVNIAAGFSFADTPDTGVSFMIVTSGDPANARRHLRDLALLAWEHRAEGNIAYPAVDEVLARILPVTRGPIILVEPSDNIGGGAPGDGTGILRALLRHDVPNSAVILNDPRAIALAHAARPGGALTLQLGGIGSALDEGPVELAVAVASVSDGRFTLEDAQSHLASMCGRFIDMGPCAVVHHRGITILLTSKKTPPFDLGQWRSQGIEPTRLDIIAVKAAIAHRRAYDPIVAASYWVDTPGPCSSNLARFPFDHLRRPIYPLDANAALPLHHYESDS